MAFAYDDKALVMIIETRSVPILLVGPDKTPYFRCNDVAQVLGYSNYYKAVAKHVRPRQTKSLDELLQGVCPILGGPLGFTFEMNKCKYANMSSYLMPAMSSLVQWTHKPHHQTPH